MRCRFEVVTRTVKLEAIGVVQGRVGLNAEQCFLILGIVFVNVVKIVGGQKRHSSFASQTNQFGFGALFNFDAVAHQLAVVVFDTENLLHLSHGLDGVVPAAKAKQSCDFTGRATGGANQAGSVTVQQLSVNARFVEHALHVGERRQLEEVLHALGCSSQQGHVRVSATRRHIVSAAVTEVCPGSVGAMNSRRNVGFHSNNRLDAGLFGGVVKLVGGMDVAVIGHRDCGLTICDGGVNERLHLGGAVENRVLGVHVEVHKGCVFLGHFRFVWSVNTKSNRTPAMRYAGSPRRLPNQLGSSIQRTPARP